MEYSYYTPHIIIIIIISSIYMYVVEIAEYYHRYRYFPCIYAYISSYPDEMCLPSLTQYYNYICIFRKWCDSPSSCVCVQMSKKKTHNTHTQLWYDVGIVYVFGWKELIARMILSINNDKITISMIIMKYLL